jgi:hypothetical protein
MIKVAVLMMMVVKSYRDDVDGSKNDDDGGFVGCRLY